MRAQYWLLANQKVDRTKQGILQDMQMANKHEEM